VLITIVALQSNKQHIEIKQAASKEKDKQATRKETSK
jgi:hypothetical protein